MLFFQKPKGPVSWLVVGLGNTGDRYEGTRHNVGFDVVDQIADTLDIPVQRLKYRALTNTAALGGETVLLMKPVTFMNLSGEAVEQAAGFFKIPPERIIVISDEVALEPGKQGNVAAGSVTIMAAMPVGIKACTNPEAFSGGDDEEDDSSLRRRLLDSYLRLPNGANAAYYEQTALSRTGVAAALAVRCPRGVGSVDLYVATDAGIPDQDLLRELNDYLQEKREISVDLRVLAPTAKAVNISVAVQPAGGFTFDQARSDADAALRAAFTGAMLGREVTLAFLGNLLYELESVQNYRFTRPSADMAASPTVLPCLGSVTISDWGN